MHVDLQMILVNEVEHDKINDSVMLSNICQNKFFTELK